MRVLHLSAGNLFGGIETYLITLARGRHLAPEMEPHFGLCFPGRLRDELAQIGVPLHDLGPVRLSRPWTAWQARRRLKRLLGEGGFDSAITHGCWPHAIFAPTLRRAGVRLVNMVHGDLSHPNWLDRWAARTPPNVVLANSRFTATPAAKLFSRSQVDVLYLPVPAPELPDRESVRREVRGGLGTAANAVVILQASRLEAWKGQAVHLEALARLRDVPDWEAWFVGGPQKAGEAEFLRELEATAKRTKLDGRVRFLGQRSDVPRLMTAADVYCQPNTGPEPFGLVLVEALQTGLPVVTSGFGGAAEIVDERCGVLTPPNDPAAVAETLRELIADPARRQRLGAAGPIRAAELCDPAQHMTQLAEHLCGRTPIGVP